MYKTKNAKRWFAIIAVAVSILAISMAVFLPMYMNNKNETAEVADSRNMAFAFTNSPNLRLAATTATSSGVTLTATVLPSNASDKSVDWSVEFVNASSTWASGKTASSYVSVTPTSDGATTATIKALQAFGEQIKITCASRVNPNATASCTADYGQKLSETATIAFANDTFVTSKALKNSGIQTVEPIKPYNWQALAAAYCGNTVTFTFMFGSTYTIAASNASYEVQVKPTTEFYTALKAQGIAKSTNTWEKAGISSIYALIAPTCNVTLVSTTGYDQTNYDNLDKYNNAILASTGTYDFDIKITVTTSLETKEYLIQCKFNKNGSAFNANTVTLDKTSITF